MASLRCQTGIEGGRGLCAFLRRAVAKLLHRRVRQVASWMGMCDCGFTVHFPNLFETLLRESLRASEFISLSAATGKDTCDRNLKCRECAFVDRCSSGCRNSVPMQCDDYYGIGENLCCFYENGWEVRLTRAAEEPLKACLKRKPAEKELQPVRNRREDRNGLFLAAALE